MGKVRASWNTSHKFEGIRVISSLGIVNGKRYNVHQMLRKYFFGK